MLAAMSSMELTKWRAYFGVRDEEEQHRRDVIESGDGVVVRYGRDEDDDDDEDEDGPAE